MGEVSLPGADDFELVNRAQLGDQRAFAKIIERHHDLVFAVVRSVLGDRDEVDDTVQNVFIKIYRGLSGFQGRSKLSSWIYQIARNQALNTATRYRPEVMPIEELDLAGPESTGPEERYRNRRLRDMLEQAMARLDETQRIALDLYYMGGRSYNEIAEIMNVPIGTVKTHIHRGKIELRRIMTRRPPGGPGGPGKELGDL
jgi:RNA polymerase sigma-70 factor (ECF subfamily)